MKIILNKIFFNCITFFCITGHCYSQQSPVDSAAVDYTAHYFNESIGHSSRLYNGPEYIYADPRFKGNAFFGDISSWRDGSVNYDGIIYQNVPMLYDIYRHVIVVRMYNNFSSFSLLNERIADFDLNGHHFVNIHTSGSDNLTGIRPDIYDQLYNGRSEILANYDKNIQTNTSSVTGIETYYLFKTSYYLKKGDSYYSFGNLGSMLSILKDKKKEITQYIKKSQIKFKDNPAEAIVKIAAYYDQLNN